MKSRISWRRRAGTAISTGVLAIAVAGVPGMATDVPAGTASTQDLLKEHDEVREQVRPVYEHNWPELDDKDLDERYSTAQVRHELVEKWSADPEFGGIHFDFPGNVLTVFGRDERFLKRSVDELASSLPSESTMTARTQVVRWSAHDLIAASTALSEHLPMDKEDFGVTLDYRSNAVVVLLPARYEDAREALERDGRYVVEMVKTYDRGEPAACTDRYGCGRPLRGGINIGRFQGTDSTDYCTLGFTTRATDGSRWVYTAGHCVPTIDSTTWGHGEQEFGQARVTRNSGGADYVRIRNSNPYWLAGTFGWVYRTPAAPGEINYAVSSDATISVGDTVCYGGRWFTTTTTTCGVIISRAPSTGGRPHVEGPRVCGGDSGGPVTYIAGSARWAYGLISGTISPRDATNCIDNDGTGVSYFSPLPAINAHSDSVSAALVRVDVR